MGKIAFLFAGQGDAAFLGGREHGVFGAVGAGEGAGEGDFQAFLDVDGGL